MAQVAHDPSAVPRVPGARIGIIQSGWHRELTDVMVKHCKNVLKIAGADQPQVHIMPGSLEIPLAARRLKRHSPDLEAIIVFGIILKGATMHFEMLLESCIQGFHTVMFEEDIPIINEILPVMSIDHAIERSADNEFNKGIEAAIAAAQVIEWRRRHPAA